MLKFVIKRILSAIPTLLVTLILIFVAVRIMPGDAAYAALGEGATIEELDAWREAHGLNKSIPEQFLDFCAGALKGDMGNSLLSGVPVTERLMDHLEPTLMLVLLSTLISVALGVPIGIYSALKRGSWMDNTLMSVSMVGMSTPSFWWGLMLCLWFAVELDIFPVQGYRSIAQYGLWESLRHLLLPAIAMGTRGCAGLARYTRSCMLDVMNKDYVRTARAKGVREGVVVTRHMLRTTMAPIITNIGMSIAGSFGGALITEQIFMIPGVGMLAYSAINTRDLPQIQAIVVYVAMVYIGINIILDILYKYFDPRIELD